MSSLALPRFNSLTTFWPAWRPRKSGTPWVPWLEKHLRLSERLTCLPKNRAFEAVDRLKDHLCPELQVTPNLGQ